MPATPPLRPRWLAADVGRVRAGLETTARIEVENAGSATWRSRGDRGLQLSYHWLDPLGNPIVWDGRRTALPHDVPPGARLEVELPLRVPRPPGEYVLQLDLVEELHFWLNEVGCEVRNVPVKVEPRISERTLAVHVVGGEHPATAAALAAQTERVSRDRSAAEAVATLVAGAIPPLDWAARMLDAHAEGHPAVGPALDVRGSRGRRRELEAWAQRSRNPRFALPLLLPSVLQGLEVGEHLGLPAYAGDDRLFEGGVVVQLP